MQKKMNNIGGYHPTSFYDRNEGKKPILLYIIPILMVLVVAGSIYLAYRDSLPEETSSQPTSSQVKTSSGNVRTAS